MSALRSQYAVRACIAALLVSVSSCSTADRAAGPDQPGYAPDFLVEEGGLPGPGESLVACTPQPKVRAHADIGPQGGVLDIGPHRLVVPPGALDTTVRITGVALSDSVVSVRLRPEGLTFARPVRLTLSYVNCPFLPWLLPEHVAYTSEELDLLQLLSSADDTFPGQVSADLDHFSRYAVAW